MKYFLITTALEHTWREEGPILFLGEWCRLFSRRQHWVTMDAEVLPYHWDDQNKFDRNYAYLRELYERLLVHLSNQLNRIHGVNHDVRYWRILVGPWLAYFTQILFDRWCAIKNAVSTYNLSATIVITGNEDAMVPTDMEHLNKLMVDDEWNHYIYSFILREFTTVPIITRAGSNDLATRIPIPGLTHKTGIKSQLAACYTKVASVFVRDHDAFFISTHLPFFDEMRLHCQFRQIPLRWFTVKPVHSAVDWRRREWVLTAQAESNFEKCALALIPRQIPTIYVEGYARLIDQINRLPWPKHPKIIFTSGALWHDIVSMAYTSEKVERGAFLAYGQHGGVYGIAKFTWAETHEIAIADKYLTWGWIDDMRSKVTPVGMLRGTYSFKYGVNSRQNILLVLESHNRYSARLDSNTKSSQLLTQINNAFSFVESLPHFLKTRVVVRLYRHEFGWEHLLRWQERYPGVRIDDGLSRMHDLLRNTRLAVYAYNSSGYLEAFASDFPAILYWDPAVCTIRDSAVPYFEELKRVGLFHEAPESAAQHIATIWDDVGGWWASADVRAVLARFTHHYCRKPADLLPRIEASLRKMMAGA